MKNRGSVSNDEFIDIGDFSDEDYEEYSEKRTRKHTRRDFSALKKRAEEKIEKKRLKDQLGYYGANDVKGMDY